MVNIHPIKVIFFDLGNTLVKQNPLGGNRTVWVDGAKEAVFQLSEANVKLGLLSNTGDLTRAQLIDDLPTDFDMDIFDSDLITLSSEVGVKKPQFRIFAHAIDNARVAPLECLFCTEELSHILIAQEIGMRAIWLKTGDIKHLTDKLIESGSLFLAE